MSPRIVCGVDSSADARRAAEVAAGLAELFEAELVLVHVAQVEPIPGSSGHPDGRRVLQELALETGESVLDEVAAVTGIDEGRRRAEIGATTDVLRRVALEERASMIVVGCRGRGGLRAALVGSTSAALCRSAPCPVVVVPPEAGHAEALREAGAAA